MKPLPTLTYIRRHSKSRNYHLWKNRAHHSSHQAESFSLQAGAKNINRALAHQNQITMSYVRNWLHCVWGTKNRFPFLTRESKTVIINHIMDNAKIKKIYIDIINGHTEHLHCIIKLHQDQCLSDVMQLIKGESSYWINKTNLVKHKFEWADEYYAASVSVSHLQRVRAYIANQEEHHRKKCWQEECDEFMERYGFDKMRG